MVVNWILTALLKSSRSSQLPFKWTPILLIWWLRLLINLNILLQMSCLYHLRNPIQIYLDTIFKSVLNLCQTFTLCLDYFPMPFSPGKILCTLRIRQDETNLLPILTQTALCPPQCSLIFELKYFLPIGKKVLQVGAVFSLQPLHRTDIQ